MAGTFFDKNGVEHALTPETRPMADALSFGVDPNALPPLTPPPPAPFVGTPSQAPAGFSGVSPMSAFPAIPGAGATGTWDAAPATTSSTLPETTRPDGSIVVDSGGATTTKVASDTPPDPAGPQYATTTDTVVEGMTSGAKKQWDEVKTSQLAALKSGNEVQREKDNEAALASIAAQAELRRFTQQENEKQAAKEQAKIEWDNKIKSADDRYRSANIDSGKLWRDSSTGSKIAAGVGIMLGALSQALTGKDNPALKIIESAIDRDIDIQKANMEKLGKEKDSTRSAYSTYLQATGSEDAARNQMHILALQNIDAGLKAKTASLADSTAAAALQKQSADIQAEIVDRQTKGSIFRQTTKVDPITAKPTPAGTSHWNDTIGKEMNDRLNIMNSLDRVDKALADQKNAAKIMGPIDAALLNVAADAGFEVPEEYINLKTETGTLVAGILKVMSGVGVNTEEYKRWKDMLPTVNKNPENAKAALRAFRDKERAAYETARTGFRGGMASPQSQAAWDATYPSFGGGNKQDFKPAGTP
jgi:hypothetical protein